LPGRHLQDGRGPADAHHPAVVRPGAVLEQLVEDVALGVLQGAVAPAAAGGEERRGGLAGHLLAVGALREHREAHREHLALRRGPAAVDQGQAGSEHEKNGHDASHGCHLSFGITRIIVRKRRFPGGRPFTAGLDHPIR
jgi:hypothetical protein